MKNLEPDKKITKN